MCIRDRVSTQSTGKSVFIALTAIVGIGFTSSAQTETERKTPVKEQQTVPITQERKPVIVAPTGAKEEAAPAVKPTQDPAGRKAKRPEVMHKQEAQETVGAPETEVHKNADKRSESCLLYTSPSPRDS
eukprot:TRINITY_DN7509_c0_g1_i1.p1 TRINITY_DN7509_c0_g1~~TRINITY_DN7509_c0_g1_i1.p1  ORF type:complete len:128 (-),score=4.38 TRINITY_DN7509_c0_g1_i1:146-529(-)